MKTTLFLILPLLVFLVHLKWGTKLWIFGFTDGWDSGIIITICIYTLGILLLILLSSNFVAYTLLILSCVVRPFMFLITQFSAVRYNKKHSPHKLKHALHGEVLQQGAEALKKSF